MSGGDELSFEELLARYLEPPVEPNLDLVGVRVVWVEGDERLGALHMARKHGVARAEVELEAPMTRAPHERERAGAGGVLPTRTPHDALADEAARWDSGELTPAGWSDAPDAIPRVRESKAVSVRFPTSMLSMLKAFARREGVGYQVLLKQWLDERIRQEAAAMRDERGPLRTRRPGHAAFRNRCPADAVLEDSPTDTGPRRRRVG